MLLIKPAITGSDLLLHGTHRQFWEQSHSDTTRQPTGTGNGGTVTENGNSICTHEGTLSPPFLGTFLSLPPPAPPPHLCVRPGEVPLPAARYL